MNDNRKQVSPLNPDTTPSKDGVGPVKPNIERPDSNNLLKRMQRVNPDLAKKYKQRSGE